MKVCPAVIHYKGVNGVLETQEPCGAARYNGAVLHHKDHRWLDQASQYRNSTIVNMMSIIRGHVRHICVMAVLRNRAR